MEFTILLKHPLLLKPQIVQGINKNFSMKSKDLKKMRGMVTEGLVTYYMRKVWPK